MLFSRPIIVYSGCNPLLDSFRVTTPAPHQGVRLLYHSSMVPFLFPAHPQFPLLLIMSHESVSTGDCIITKKFQLIIVKLYTGHIHV